MKLLVFGASGRTGALAVAHGLERGHEMTAFVREGSRHAFGDHVPVAVGDLRDHAAVASALAGKDAVISALGPAAGVTATEVSDALREIVVEMERVGPSRLVITANATVFTDEEVTGDFANVAAEHRRDAQILGASSLDWTIVATPLLTDRQPTHDYEAVIDEAGTGRSITRADFAAGLLDALERDEWVEHAVCLTNAAR